MSTSKKIATLAALAAFSLIVTGCSGGAAAGGGGGGGSADEAKDCTVPIEDGFTEDTVKVGQLVPMSGPLALFGGDYYSAKGYYEMINEAGGVKMGDGVTRKIELIAADDQYDPSVSLVEAQRLVENEGIAAFAGSFGSATNLAIAPVIEEACVPNLWVTASTTKLYNPDETPFSLGGTMISERDSAAWVEYLAENMPEAKIAVLGQSGEVNDSYIQGFEKNLEGTDLTLVEALTYEPTDTDVRQQVTTLAATDADVFFLGATPVPMRQALQQAVALGWEPMVILPRATTINWDAMQELDEVDVLDKLDYHATITYLDPSAPDADEHEGLRLYKEWFEKAGGLEQHSIADGVAGWNAAFLFVEALKQTKEPNRLALWEAATHLDVEDNSHTNIPTGIQLSTNWPDDAEIQEGASLQRWNQAENRFEELTIVDAQQ